MKILALGDIVGKPGRDAIRAILPDLKKKEGIDLVIANAENAAGGSGITPEITYELRGSGVDVITSGDHIWKRKEVLKVIGNIQWLLRPANYPAGAPGTGATVIKAENGINVGVINLLGRVFMQPLECPFRVAWQEVKRLREITPVIVVDIHAEATSEKIALGWYLDGMVSAVVGTHTHVQTADEKILPKGTGYLTDLGMVGSHASVLGRRVEQIIDRFITQMPRKFELATEDVQMNGVLITVDEKTGKCVSIQRMQKRAELKNYPPPGQADSAVESTYDIG